MVFGMIPGFYDYETFIESFLRFEPGTNFGCGRRIDQLAILAFLKKKVCKLWDLNPRVQSTNDLESLPLDHSGKLAINIFQTFF